MRNWRPSIGRFIEEADNTSRSRVVVLGQTVRKDLFPEEDPIGKQVKINGLPFRVIGVMEEKGASFLGDQDAIAFIPLSTAQERLFPQLAQAQTGDRIVSTIYLQVTSDAVRPQVEADVRRSCASGTAWPRMTRMTSQSSARPSCWRPSAR